jgi:hypothetical protein
MQANSENSSNQIEGNFIQYRGQQYYQIKNYDHMDPFFITLTSPADHWMFISTTGGITAGRINADNAIFPYYTVDRITENSENTGSKTIIKVKKDNHQIYWEPFSCFSREFAVERTLLKNVPGNSLIFREHNFDLDLIFELEWTNSKNYGIIKRSSLENCAAGSQHIEILDGVQNILPAFVTSQVQGNLSNLLDAYKRSELVNEGNLGIFALSATLTDLAEPSEALAANTWWQSGLENETYILCSKQINSFRNGKKIVAETDIKGERGAYLANTTFHIKEKAKREWFFCGEVNQGHSAVHGLIKELHSKEKLVQKVLSDIRTTSENLTKIIGLNDGLQKTGDQLTSSHHYANVMFNTMRGGYFANNYEILSSDLADYIESSNEDVFKRNQEIISSLGEITSIQEIEKMAATIKDPDLIRLLFEYLPVTFSRRHGDPSRPWNRFSISTTDAEGNPKIGYEGNWRDIFQNWEALLLSNPRFVFSIIFKFLNATTADGYNPYRISRNGIDWEKPEPENPWANIGYWSDHQIIYLLKLMELAEQYYPGELQKYLEQSFFVYANVPYEIKTFESIIRDSRDTIDFNFEKDRIIGDLCVKIGSDGRLLRNSDITHGNGFEKLLILMLAKISNYIPDGGIWMNTQRPEWNDANNALVGNGISMVTLSYLIRYTGFLAKTIFKNTSSIEIHSETANWFYMTHRAMNQISEKTIHNSRERYHAVRQLGEAGSEYRSAIYSKGFSQSIVEIKKEDIMDFLKVTEKSFQNTLQNNKRKDNLIHSYNRLEIGSESMEVHTLYEMLEGQVAGLSSQHLDAKEELALLNALRNSSMYREDQDSYMLYPNRELNGFLKKNTLSSEEIAKSQILTKLSGIKDNGIIESNIHSGAHFNYMFKNSKSLVGAIEAFNCRNPKYSITTTESQELVKLFEDLFEHDKFTGRSGTFFAYEGLGSIYWHMVSKLLLAVQECAVSAHESGDNKNAEALREKYFEVRHGIGFNKQPQVYGAFPIDPYSHSPFGKGAKQPGMTGQVKEEVITRFAELGLYIRDGEVIFDNFLVHENEYLTEASKFTYINVSGEKDLIELEADSYGFTFCQVPISVKRSKDSVSKGLTVYFADGSMESYENMHVNTETSASIFNKEGRVKFIDVAF